jgi:hypothetical protein
MWARSADKPDILGVMNNSREAFGFGAVRDAIHRDLIITLLTTLEPGQSRSACMPALFDIAEDSSVVELMQERSRRPKEVKRRLATAKSKFDLLVRSKEVKALRTVRNKVIAHVANRPVAHKAKYGDERKVLEAIIPIFEDLAAAIQDRDFKLGAKRDRWHSHADTFWTHVARPR